MRKKNNDYCGGEGSSPFHNFNGSRQLGIDPVKGILMRMMDKMQRVSTFCDMGRLAVVEESVDDALEDIINYCILAKGMIHERREKPVGRTESKCGDDAPNNWGVQKLSDDILQKWAPNLCEEIKNTPTVSDYIPSMGPLAPRTIKPLT
jgi:hypothetical protein